jgi:mRNA-degrading endonuclease toxin of MazEF toxin-antitoxin module
LKRGEIYRSALALAERGHKPGYYVVVSRTFIAQNADVSTVICAPVYGEILGLATEVPIGPDEGVIRTSAIRCDFLTLMFKKRLTHLVGILPPPKLAELDRALTTALEIEPQG